MPNLVPAAGEAMPSITTNRRHFLLGLAAASAAAAASTPVAAIAAENPKLIELANQLPAVAQAYHAAYRAYWEMGQRSMAATPLAPDEITEMGASNPCTEPQQGETECYATGRYLFRKDEKWPRRIMDTCWQIDLQINRVRKAKRLAKKAGAAAEFLDAEEEIRQLKTKLARVKPYEAEREHARAAAQADHERLYPIREQAFEAFATHVSAVMAEADWTMEGLIIKAATLMEWSRLDKHEKLHGHILGADWHASIAESILRHAQGGVS